MKEFFFVNLQAGISHSHYKQTSSQIISRDLSKWTHSKAYFSNLYNMFEKHHLLNSFLLYVLVEILQLVHEISSFPRILIISLWVDQTSYRKIKRFLEYIYSFERECSNLRYSLLLSLGILELKNRVKRPCWRHFSSK